MPTHQEKDDSKLAIDCKLYINSLSFTWISCSSVIFCWRSLFAFLPADYCLLSDFWILLIRFLIFESWYATWSSIVSISSLLFYFISFKISFSVIDKLVEAVSFSLKMIIDGVGITWQMYIFFDQTNKFW